MVYIIAVQFWNKQNKDQVMENKKEQKKKNKREKVSSTRGLRLQRETLRWLMLLNLIMNRIAENLTLLGHIVIPHFVKHNVLSVHITLHL